MTTTYVSRDLLAAAFPGNPRLVYAMEQQALAVADNADATATVAATANDAAELAQRAKDEAELRQIASAVLDELSKLDTIPGLIERVGTGEFIARPVDNGQPGSLMSQDLAQAALDAKLDDSQASVFGLQVLGTASATTLATLIGLAALAYKATVNDADWSGADLTIDNGGTGASSAAAARVNLSLDNVSNTSDANKPVSTAAAAALALKIDLTQKAAANGVASLGADGKIPSAQLSPLAITTPTVVASEAAQLALVAQEGDVAIRSDIKRSYIMNVGTSGTMADWNELLTPTDAVLSVAGKTGTVSLAKADVGLGSVDNTLDVAKPVSTAQQAALNLKAPIASPSFTGRAVFTNGYFLTGTMAAPTGGEGMIFDYAFNQAYLTSKNFTTNIFKPLNLNGIFLNFLVNDIQRAQVNALGINVTGTATVSDTLSTKGMIAGVRTVTAAATLVATDHTLLCNAALGAIVVTTPQASTNAGRVFVVKKTDASANAVTLDPFGTETIDGAATKALSAQWASLTFQSDGANWMVL